MPRNLTHCDVCGRLLQLKWFKTEIYPDENATIYKPDNYGVCRTCFLLAMGVEPNVDPADDGKVRKMPASKTKPVRTRRTPVTRADIDRYRRSARADRDNKRKAADRESGESVSEGSGIRWGEPTAMRPPKRSKLQATSEYKADGSGRKKVP